ncbi:MAG: aldehyde ferredoxin oxidoreductase [Spirochaetes bacterium]|nr:aldehyde ferredoxin oxidoreductase [Spirochaetota bacterium]
MNGWQGKIAAIDLTSGRTDTITPSRDVYERYLGGRGLAGHFLCESITLPWDSPSMPLVFMTGPLVDTPSPTSGRMTVASRSPLTGAVGDTSAGGRFGTRLKRAGWDGIIITGRAPGTCRIDISDGTVTIRDAAGLSGMDIASVVKTLPRTVSSAVAGPAAEHGCLFSNIVIDGDFFAGRTGLGLVMAAKNLKCITVNGSGTTALHDPSEIAKAKEEIRRLAAASPVLKGELGISEFGTGAIYDLISTRRMMPTENFRRTFYEQAAGMNAYAFRQRYGSRKTGCAGCHILCKKRDRQGRPIPEFETMSHFSALLCNGDTDAVMEANLICNNAGMDTISAAATLACYAEIRGAPLTAAEIVSLLGDITDSRGEGEILKLGSWRYAAERGVPESSISVKRLELPAYDPRGAYGMALAYAVSTRGGCHLRAYPISHEILRKPVATDRFSFSGKARIIKLSEDVNAAVDSLTACKFIFFAATLEEYARAFYGATGVAADAQGLLSAGERICFHERIMNGANGFTADDDDLPERFFRQEGSSGNGIIVRPLDRGEFLKSRSNYFMIRGLDERGHPLESRRAELGLP